MRKGTLIQCIGIAILLAGCGSDSDDVTGTESSETHAPLSNKAPTGMNHGDASAAETPLAESTPPGSGASKRAVASHVEIQPSTQAPAEQTTATDDQPTSADVTNTEPSLLDGLVSRDTELKMVPQVTAQNIQSLAAGSTVRILERQGGWYRVITDVGQGWVRLLHISRQQGQTGTSITRDIDAVAAIATGRSGTGNVASTTGIRGFNEEDLSLADPDFVRLDELDNFSVSQKQAATEAINRGLKARRIEYLQGPSR